MKSYFAQNVVLARANGAVTIRNFKARHKRSFLPRETQYDTQTAVFLLVLKPPETSYSSQADRRAKTRRIHDFKMNKFVLKFAEFDLRNKFRTGSWSPLPAGSDITVSFFECWLTVLALKKTLEDIIVENTGMSSQSSFFRDVPGQQAAISIHYVESVAKIPLEKFEEHCSVDSFQWLANESANKNGNILLTSLE